MVKYLTRAAVSDELAELQRVRMLLEDGPGQETCVWKQFVLLFTRRVGGRMAEWTSPPPYQNLEKQGEPEEGDFPR